MTTPSFLALVFAALAAGLVGGALTGLWLAPTVDDTDAPLALVSENAALERRLAALEQRFDTFSDQVTSWKADVVPVEPLVSAPLPIDAVDAPEAMLGDVATTSDPAVETPEPTSDVPTPALRDEVAAVLEEIRRDEKVAGWRSRVQDKRDRLGDSMEYLSENLELSDYQATELREAILEQYGREDDVISMWERGVPDDIVGRQKDGDGRLFADEIASFLTEEQVAAFWQIVKSGG